MTLTNPLMLAGIAAAVLPIVLYLIGRARARSIDWGATMLLSNHAGDAAAGRMRGPLLLAVRCLALAGLAVALARPTSTDANAAEPSVAVVIVLDASPSMNHPEQDTTRFELARRVALDRLARLRQGDQAALVVLGAVPSADVALTPDLQAVASQIASLYTGTASADQADGERRARGMLADAGVDGGEVLLIGDRQRSAWEPLRQSAADGVSQARTATVTAVPVGSTFDDNVGVESVELLNPPAVVNRPARFAVTVRNGGEVPHGEIALTVSAGRNLTTRGTVAVAARGRTRVVRTLTPTRLGPAVVSAEIQSTGVPNDDAMRLAIDVVAAPRVALIAPATATTRPAWTKPFGSAADPGNGLGSADIAVLTEPPTDIAAVAAIERFVAGGGGLFLSPTASMTPQTWNQRLWKNGFGFAPAASAVVRPEPPVRPTNVPAFAEPTADDFDWPAAGVREFWKLAPGANESTFGRLGDAPLLVDRTFGRGRVMTAAIALDGGRADAAPPDYSAFADAIVRRLMPRPLNRNVDVGVPLEMTGPDVRDRAAFVLRPDGRFDRVNSSTNAGVTTFRYGRTDLPGRYVVRVGERPAVDWIVRPDPAEAELNFLDDASLAGLLQSTAVTLRADTPPKRTRTDWSAIVVTGVILLLAAEVWIAGASLPRRRERR